MSPSVVACERGLDPETEMPVGMVAIEQPHEARARPPPAHDRAAAAGARAAACARARCRASARFGAVAISASSAAPARRNRVERRQRHDDGIGADIDVEIGAVARQRIGHLEGRAAAAALVEQIGGKRGQARALRRDRRRCRRAPAARRDTTGTLRCAIARTSRPLRQHAAMNGGKAKRPLGPAPAARCDRRGSRDADLDRARQRQRARAARHDAQRDVRAADQPVAHRRGDADRVVAES